MRQGAFGVTPHSRPCLGCGASGSFTLLAALERVVEGQAIVARSHRFVGLSECGRGGRELGRGVLFGSGRTGRGDRAPGFADLLIGRLATGGGNRAHDGHRRAQQKSVTHDSTREYIG